MRRLSVLPWILFWTAACVTINVYFPAAAVEKAADQIVKETWGEQGKKPAEPPKGQEGRLSIGRQVAGLHFGPAEAFAEEANINITTPAIRTLKDAIRERADSIKPYMDKGHAGLSGDGLLVVRSMDGLNLKEKAALNRLVEAENKDREALYLEIARANNISEERVGDIRKIFAQSWIGNAQTGWWVQNTEGQWMQKK